MTLLNLGHCYTELGKTASAWEVLIEAYERVASERPANHAARKIDAERRDEIGRLLALLEPKLTRLEILYPHERPKGLTVTSNGRDVTASLGKATPLDPGRYELQAQADGYRSWMKHVDVGGAGKTETVVIPVLSPVETRSARQTIRRKTDDGSPASPPQLSPAKAEAPAQDRTRRVVGVPMAVAGGIAMGAGLGFGWVARSKEEEAIEQGCDAATGACPTPEAYALNRQAQRHGFTSKVLLGGGLVGLTVGAFLYWGGQTHGGHRQMHVAPALGPNGGQLSVMGTF